MSFARATTIARAPVVFVRAVVEPRELDLGRELRPLLNLVLAVRLGLCLTIPHGVLRGLLDILPSLPRLALCPLLGLPGLALCTLRLSLGIPDAAWIG